MNILRISNSKTFVAEPFFTTNYLKTDVFSRQMIFCLQNFRKKLFFKTPLDTCLLVVHLGIWKGWGGLSRITGRRFPPETTMPKTKKNMSDCFFIPCWCPCFFCVKSLKMKSAFCKYHLAKICLQLWSILKSFFELLLIPESKV